MPINWNMMDTQQPQKLAALFNHNMIAMRNAEMERNNLSSLSSEAQLMGQIEQMRQAPIVREQQAQDREYQMKERQRQAMERAQSAEQNAAKKQLFQQLKTAQSPEEQKQILMQLFPEEAAKNAFKPATARDFNQPFLPDGSPNVAYQQYKLAEQRAGRAQTADNVNWQTVTAADGSMIQVHPRTGEIRKLGIKGAAKADKPLTEFQGKSALFGSRAAAASDIIGGMSKDLAGGASTLQYWQDTPLIGRAVNAMSSQQEQKLAQAQRDFVNAVLRLESGAAIGQGEFDNASQQYFPQSGDSEEVIQQKAQNRERAISGLGKLAGQSGEEYIGQQREAAFPATSVRLPDGRIKVFPSAAAAQAFKKQAGL